MIFKKKNSKINKIEKFWIWFTENNKKFLFLNQIDSKEIKDKLLDEFLKELHEYCDKLYFEIGGHPEENNVELIISAEGNVDYFDQVEKLITSAPELKDWQIIAFKPPMGKGFKTNYRGKEFDPSKIIFIPLNHQDDPTLVGLKVCYPDYSDDERDIFINGTYIVIDTLIGEKSTALDINYLEVARTPENIKDYDFGHLENIKEFIEEKKNAS
jgi:hypothetical protein